MNKETKEHPLAKRRKELGYSREKLSKKLNGAVSVETIGRIERGERKPRADTLNLIANALECEPDYILGRIKSPNRTISEVAEKVPLSRVSIELLRDLKQECDDRICENVLGDDSHLTAFLTDCVIAHMISTHEIGGINEIMLSLVHQIADASKIMAEYDDNTPTLPDRYRMAKWEMEMCKEKIGSLFTEIITDHIKMYARDKIKLTDRILLGYLEQKKENN